MELIRRLHWQCFGDEFPDITDRTAMWAVKNERPVGFAIARKLRDEPTVFLERAGVLATARGHNLQVRLIHARVNWARKLKQSKVITYTDKSNYPSITNLIRAGFVFYSPAWKWAGDQFYFVKST